MEKNEGNSMCRIGLIGPESVGKSTLAHQLAHHFGMPAVDEYARTYVEKLNRDYNYQDVENIAFQQTHEYELYQQAFFDTDMIITKVWFDVVYNQRPMWLDEWMSVHKMDFYLLLKPDIQWVADASRENGDRREWLFDIYRQEIEYTHVPYSIIDGVGEERIQNAINAIIENIKILSI